MLNVEENKKKRWLIIYLVTFLFLFVGIAGIVIYIDPFMHYHAPLTSKYYYNLDNQRSQNDGITKHFEYNAVVTGSSMTENFKKTEVDELFSVDSIKIPYSGGSYKEINDNLCIALKRKRIQLVIRCLDMERFFDDANTMRTDLGQFPVYLYNKNPLDDVKYLLNRDVLYTRCWIMVKNRHDGLQPGIASFDDYSNWMGNYLFGKNAVLASKIEEGYNFSKSEIQYLLTEEDKKTIKNNIELNVTDLAEKYPNVNFYYFFSPYSVAWWGEKFHDGLGEKWIEAEKYIIELVLPYENIHLFSWNDQFDIITDLNNYKDFAHYGEWVNSWMLVQMKNDKGRLIEGNYKDYIERERKFYMSYDYNSMYNQEDYENDSYAADILLTRM